MAAQPRASKMAAERDTPGHVGRARAAPPARSPSPLPPGARAPGASECCSSARCVPPRLKGAAPRTRTPAAAATARPPRAAVNKEAPETAAAAGRGPAGREGVGGGAGPGPASANKERREEAGAPQRLPERGPGRQCR